MENPNKMDDLGIPLFLETPIYKWVIPYQKQYEEAQSYFIFQMGTVACQNLSHWAKNKSLLGG